MNNMSEIEIYTTNYFSERYNKDIYSRFEKLNEEVQELNEAIIAHKNATDPADRKRKAKQVCEEISDVQGVLTHLANLMGTNFKECLIESVVKSKVREHVPGYKRSDKLKKQGKRFNFETMELEDIPEELKEGDLAVFWDKPEFSIIAKYGGLISTGDGLLHLSSSGHTFRNAVKFDNFKQYENIIKGERHTEHIVCPQCGKVCTAEVKKSLPWNILVHRCEHCGFLIMESDWERVES